MKIIIIGDVHGCYLELEELLKKTKLDIKEDKLIFVGDLMDKGPESYEVLMKVIKLKQQMKDRLVYVMGNHEDFMINAQDDAYTASMWMCNGARQTIKSFSNNGKNIYKYCDWIRNNTQMFYDNEIRVVHAGLWYEELSENHSDTLLWDRDTFCYGQYTGKLTIIGHTPVKNPNDGIGTIYKYNIKYSIPETGLIDIDTGCVFNNKLTAMIIENDKMKFKNVHFREYTKGDWWN